jgi:LmbE family N-acetylglucosaminyl deacetylase
MTPLAEQRRFEQYDAIYISPHLDDAVYSCAGRIIKERRADKRVLVVTLFGEGPDLKRRARKGRLSDFATRREEDRAAMAKLDADYVWFNYPDFVFRRPSLADLWHIAFPFLPLSPAAMQRDMASSLLSLIEARLAPTGSVLFPLSVGFHPDHRIVFDVGRAIHALGRFTVRFSPR